MDVIADLPAGAQPPEPVQTARTLVPPPSGMPPGPSHVVASTRNVRGDGLAAQLVAMTVGARGPIRDLRGKQVNLQHVGQRANGKYTYRSMFTASNLRAKPMFRRLDPESAG